MIELVELKKLKLLDRNPRSISKIQMEKCKESLSKDPDFLTQRPILVNVVDGVYHVYAGNMRVRAAKKLGWKQILCNIDQELPDDLIKRRIILDNAHYGVNDDEILACDYDIDLLVDCGYTTESLLQDIGIHDEDDEKSEELEKKIKHCPHCNGEL
jgi:ParB-like chromosome segregation protein Spo0J